MVSTLSNETKCLLHIVILMRLIPMLLIKKMIIIMMIVIPMIKTIIMIKIIIRMINNSIFKSQLNILIRYSIN